MELENLTYDDEFVSEHSVEESFNAGSVVSEKDLSIAGCKTEEFEDYMLIEE